MGGYLWAELYREVGRGHSRRQKHHEKTQGNDTMWHVQTKARSLLKWENIKQERRLEQQGAQWSRASEDILKSLNLGYGQWGAPCEKESMLDLCSRVGVQSAVWRTEWMVAKPKARRQIRIMWENNRELHGGTPPTLFWRGYIGRDRKIHLLNCSPYQKLNSHLCLKLSICYSANFQKKNSKRRKG